MGRRDEGRLEQYRSLAVAISRHYYFPGADSEDVLQEAMIALADADRRHDPALGSFPAFAKVVINRRLTFALRTATRKKHAILSHAAGLSDAEEEASWALDPAAIVETRQDALELLRRVKEDLTPLERRCLIGHANGLSHEEITREVGGTVTRNSQGYRRYPRVYNALDKARRKLAA